MKRPNPNSYDNLTAFTNDLLKYVDEVEATNNDLRSSLNILLNKYKSFMNGEYNYEEGDNSEYPEIEQAEQAIKRAESLNPHKEKLNYTAFNDLFHSLEDVINSYMSDGLLSVEEINNAKDAIKKAESWD